MSAPINFSVIRIHILLLLLAFLIAGNTYGQKTKDGKAVQKKDSAQLSIQKMSGPDTVKRIVDSTAIKARILEEQTYKLKVKMYEEEKRKEDSIENIAKKISPALKREQDSLFWVSQRKLEAEKRAHDSIQIVLRQDSIKNYIPPVKVFPADTMQRFITRYGKDSLIRLLTERIRIAKMLLRPPMVNNNTIDGYNGAQLVLVSRHFKWGIDSIMGLKFLGRLNLYRLYNMQFGPIDVYLDELKKEAPPEDSIHQFLLRERYNEEMRLLMSAFSPYWSIPAKTFDSLVEYSVHFTTQDQMQLLYTFIEYGKAGEEKYNVVKPYAEQLFKRLYANNNLPATVKRYDYKKKNNPENIITASLNLLAYGMYGNLLNLEKSGLDIMYLISLQNEEGAWSNYLGNKQNNAISTFYGLWTLEEMKWQLENK